MKKNKIKLNYKFMDLQKFINCSICIIFYMEDHLKVEPKVEACRIPTWDNIFGFFIPK